MIEHQVSLAILDRPHAADSPLLATLASRTNLQRLQPEEIEQLRPQTEVLLIRGGFWNDLPQLVKLAPALRWIHVNMAGVEHLDVDYLTSRGVLLTNSAGVLDQPIAEFVLGSILLWSKGLHQSVLETQQNVWNSREPLLNDSLSTLILGAGGIGTKCAKLLKSACFGKVAGLRGSSRPLDPVFDERISSERLADRIHEFDVIVSCLPANPATQGFFGDTLLRNLKERMIFVNVGRGSTVEQASLARALSSRPDSLAVLDVTDPEPLPQDHELWKCQNIVISPHMAGETVERHDNFTRLFIENLNRYVHRQSLHNLVSSRH